MAKIFRVRILGQFCKNHRGKYLYNYQAIGVIARTPEEALGQVIENVAVVVKYLLQLENRWGFKIMHSDNTYVQVDRKLVEVCQATNINEFLFNGKFQKISPRDVHLLPILYPECFI